MIRSIAVMNQICKITALLGFSAILLGCKPADSIHPVTPKSPPSNSTSDDKIDSYADEATAQIEDQAETHLFKNPEQVLNEGEYQAEIIGLVYSERMEYLARTFSEAAQDNQEWFLEHAKSVEPGEPLPYDKRLGLTEAEYEEFLAIAIKTPKTQVTGQTKLTITQTEKNVFLMDGGQHCPGLTGITINLNTNTVQTAHAVLQRTTDIDAADSPIGAWAGASWKFNEADLDKMTGISNSLAIGIRKSDGKAVLYYRITNQTTDPKTRDRITLLFSLPD